MDDESRASAVLLGQIVVVAGAASGVGLAIAQRAKAAGAQLIITDRDAGRLEEAADEIGVEATAAIDADDPEQIGLFLTGLPTPVDHALIMISARHAPPLGVIDVPRASTGLERLLVPLSVARFAIQGMGAGGSLVFVSGMGGGRPHIGPVIPTAVLPALIADLAVETAPVRVNLIVTTTRVPPDEVATWALLLMTSPGLTGGTCFLDGRRTSYFDLKKSARGGPADGPR